MTPTPSAATERLADHLDMLGRTALRLWQEALREGCAGYWHRRAKDFEAARPRPGDFPGNASPADLAEADRRCAEAAEGCRLKAEFISRYGDDDLAAAAERAWAEVLAPSEGLTVCEEVAA